MTMRRAVLHTACAFVLVALSGGGGGVAGDGDGLTTDNALFPHSAGLVPPGRRQYASGNASRPLYALVDTYDGSNFWDKFTFIETSPTDPDPTHGFVLYQNRSEAERLGLISTSAWGISSLKVDHTTVIAGPKGDAKNLTGLGRKSVRIESIASYGEGLIVGEFTHLPRMQCGSWPAFWTYAEGPGWPNGGEIDIYEQWNTHPFNRQSVHMNATLTGNCTFTPSNNPLAPAWTNYLHTPDCNVTFPLNEGCSTWDFEGPYACPTGGVYALLLDPATNTLRTWAWHHRDAPSFTSPDPAEWGAPGLSIGGTGDAGDGCDVVSTFQNQTIILNLDVCGDAIGGDDWVDDGRRDGCAAATGWHSCARFAAATPTAFEGVGFGVRSIRVWQARK